MLENIEVLCHSSIRIHRDKVMYIDPFKIDKNYNDADIIFITHDHYDHYSEEDIDKVKKEYTIIVAPEGILTKIVKRGVKQENIVSVEPDKNYEIENIKFSTVRAYNTLKPFHPKSNDWVGYVIELNNVKYYIAGDTDATKENKEVKCDVAFVPVGGTYTMNYKEAVKFVNEIKPKIAIPIHYGSIVGKQEDGEKFVENLDKGIEGKILIK